MGIRPNSALVMVNLQNDFFHDGAWPVPCADQIVSRINEYIQLFWDKDLPIFASRDWHTPDAEQFTTNGGHLPPYCIRDSWGAEFNPNIQLPKTAIVLSKGTAESQSGESAFCGKDKRGHDLYDWLKALQVGYVYVCGLPFETRVRVTAIDALQAGVRARVLMDATRSRNAMPGDEERAVLELIGRGVHIQSISQLRR